MEFIERVVNNVVWDEKGKKAQGLLLAADVVRFRDGGTNVAYKLKGEGGAIVVFQGATQLNQKLNPADVGCVIYVEYLGEDESRTMTTDKNRPKLFKVLVDESSKARSPRLREDMNKLGITDEDIPF